MHAHVIANARKIGAHLSKLFRAILYFEHLE